MDIEKLKQAAKDETLNAEEFRAMFIYEMDKKDVLDWDGWRKRYNDAKDGMLKAKNEKDFNAAKRIVDECHAYAQSHMRQENYLKTMGIYEKWFSKTEQFFYYNKISEVFDSGAWESYQITLQYATSNEERQKLGKQMLTYLRKCGKPTEQLIIDFRTKWSINLAATEQA